LRTASFPDSSETLDPNTAIIDEELIIENDSMKNVIGKLQLESFVLSLQEPIQQPPPLDGYAVRLRNEREIEVDVAKGQGLNRVFEALSAQSLHVASMRTKTNRLQELFIRLVEDNDQQAGVGR